MYSKEVFFAECWIPEEKEEKVANLLSGYDVSFEIREPAEGETPPVLVKNSKLAEPFSIVTELYSLPAYGTIDPNPFIAISINSEVKLVGTGNNTCTPL
jgi:V/A-type H+-transporting ATPase subunit I